MSAIEQGFGTVPWADVPFKKLDQLSIPTGVQSDINRLAIAELRRRGYFYNASEARWERPEEEHQ